MSTDPMDALRHHPALHDVAAGLAGTSPKPGDVITTTIEGVGTMSNTCVRIADHHSPGDH